MIECLFFCEKQLWHYKIADSQLQNETVWLQLVYFKFFKSHLNVLLVVLELKKKGCCIFTIIYTHKKKPDHWCRYQYALASG